MRSSESKKWKVTPQSVSLRETNVTLHTQSNEIHNAVALI